ncbi:polysialyltransferase family glycosyltransferase [Phaeobacter sp. 22II1-1F12B]|uniref:polysialyltransferase family glycosyltransferase n=1 Tax=Phaeobacter sp. 22II1-1F12B TaxID=1317111 RepID=UPI000B52623A|nr:polysialyltransferase family glycosyltransferase [Phaeobacter sp. 22II1-1F12B]OWU72407.1 hypothetical protein ATO1_22205 [Phaeobacter sp. 22II1-1F12B]
MPETRYTIAATGLSDLATALAVLEQEEAVAADDLPGRCRLLLFAAEIALPDPLVCEFRRICRDRLPGVAVEIMRFADAPERDRLIAALPPAGHGPHVLIGNQLHVPHNRVLYAGLAPDRLLFYDNGLSSYAPHPPSVLESLRVTLPGLGIRACLGHADRLGIPPYLEGIPTTAVMAGAARHAYARLAPETAWRLGAPDLPETLLVLGTGFARTGLIDEAEEIDLHLALFRAIRQRHDGRLVFKGHPRAGPALAQACRGEEIDMLETTLPVECHVTGPRGRVFSFSSTALLTLEDHFGWESHRIAAPAMEEVFNARPQLAMIREIPVSADLELES